ncbi:MAG: hypothetical protein WBY47_02900 [Desulfobacterales bacterium]|jgi:hypothetical protein
MKQKSIAHDGTGALVINIKDMISGRLQDRGLAPVEIMRLIKDVSNVVGGAWYFNPSDVKKALKRLGWREYILDNFTLEFISLYLDDETVKGRGKPILH